MLLSLLGPLGRLAEKSDLKSNPNCAFRCRKSPRSVTTTTQDSVQVPGCTLDRLFLLVRRFYEGKQPADFAMPLRVVKEIYHLPKWVQAIFIVIADQLDRTKHTVTETSKLYSNLEILSMANSLDTQSVAVDNLISDLMREVSSGEQSDRNIDLSILEKLSMDAACNHSSLNQFTGNLTYAVNIKYNKNRGIWETITNQKTLKKRSKKREQWINFAHALATSPSAADLNQHLISTSQSKYRYEHICRLFYWDTNPSRSIIFPDHAVLTDKLDELRKKSDSTLRQADISIISCQAKDYKTWTDEEVRFVEWVCDNWHLTMELTMDRLLTTEEKTFLVSHYHIGVGEIIKKKNTKLTAAFERFQEHDLK